MSLKLVDIHTHPQFAAYTEDRDAIMQRAEEAAVGQIVVGTQKDTSQAAIDLAHKYPHTWATVGLHPIHTTKSYHDAYELENSNLTPAPLSDGEGKLSENSPSLSGRGLGGEVVKPFTSRGEVFDYDYYRKLATDEKVVAIGECGLDYFRLDEDTKQIQMNVFDAQIALANEVEKPIMLHIRAGKHAGSGTAYQDAFHMLHSKSKVSANVHFFAGDIETAKRFLSIGCTLSFTGVITFTHDYDEVVKYVPIESMMVETDAPYITPAPYRGKRNESSYARLIAARVALIKGISIEQAEAKLLDNAIRQFRLKF
ncbi:MAG: TatD family hydrolase [Candidatus Paceibacterota bacterium]|jgi:TatD DNase family protein